MKKVKPLLKILTFFNIEIVLIVISISLVSYFGYSYIKSAVKQTEKQTSSIIKNEKDFLHTFILMNSIYKKDNDILSKILNKEIEYKYLEKDVNEIIKMKSHLKIDYDDSKLFDSLIYEKYNTYIKIKDHNNNIVNINNAKINKKITLISKNVKTGIFRKKVTYDTITKSYTDINQSKLVDEYRIASIKNIQELNLLIYQNNILSLKLKSILDKNSNLQFVKNIHEYNRITDEINSSLIRYTKIVIFILIIFSSLIYLLIKDIKKKIESEYRDKYIIALLMDRAKDLINKK